MRSLNYKLEEFQFEGPLDLLLTLIQKNKIDITDLPISLLCEQYLEYLELAEKMDMELAGEFITMASRLMLIKSKMILPRNEASTEDPREDLTDTLIKTARAKALADYLRGRYPNFGRRFVKDTDEISPDRTFVHPQNSEKLLDAAKRILAYKRSERTEGMTKITPIIKRPIIPVEEKIVGIISHFKKQKTASLHTLLDDANSRSELIAIFIGVLELIKQGQLVITDSPDEFTSLHGLNTVFEITDKPQKSDTSDEDPNTSKVEESYT